LSARTDRLVVIASLALLSACGSGGDASLPTTTPSTQSSPSATVSPPPAIHSINEALAYIKSIVDVPVVYPTRALPHGLHLVSTNAVSVEPAADRRPASATLLLQFGHGGTLILQYGATTISSGCEEDTRLRMVRIGGYPGVLATSPDHAAVEWPATLHRLQGSYGVFATLPARDVLVMARSMRPVPGLEAEVPPPAC
jgi:hypothetical protein